MSSIARKNLTETTQRACGNAKMMNRFGAGASWRLRRSSSRSAFSLMEGLVVLAIVLVLVVIAVPIFATLRQRKNKGIALATMRQLSGAVTTYAGQNAGVLPVEDEKGADTWLSIARPEAKEVWYNALPRTLGRKTAADFSSSPSAFYSTENVLFLPGANYPQGKKLREPLFAIAMNSKLQRKDQAGKETPTKLADITQPARTVVLLERGVPGEANLPVQSKKDYDGSPKGSAKAFVGRYGGEGVLGFADGHVEMVKAKDLLTETGDFPIPQTDVIWTRTPEENPNKVDGGGSGKKGGQPGSAKAAAEE